MNMNDFAVEYRTLEETQLLEQLLSVTAQAQQTIESVKKALLLADSMGLFGAGLTNRLNAGTAESWERKAPALEEAPAFIAAARQSLDEMEKELCLLCGGTDDSEEEMNDDTH